MNAVPSDMHEYSTLCMYIMSPCTCVSANCGAYLNKAYVCVCVICIQTRACMCAYMHTGKHYNANVSSIKHMYVGMHVCMYVCMCSCKHVYVHVYMYMYMYTCMYTCLYVYITRMRVCMNSSMYIRIYICGNTHVCTYMVTQLQHITSIMIFRHPKARPRAPRTPTT